MTKWDPIEAKFLATQYKFGLQWDTGFTFHRILGRDRFKIRPWIQGINLLAARGNQSAIELKDDLSQKLWELDESDRYLMYHFGVGIKPSQIRVFRYWPSSERLRPVENLENVSVGVLFNSERGYITGQDSPYMAPSDALETVVPYGVDVTWAFVNSDERRMHQPVLSFEVAKYQFEIIDPKVESVVVRQIAFGAPCRLFTVGPVAAPAKYKNENKWGVKPITMAAARGLR